MIRIPDLHAPIYRLTIKDIFDNLAQREKLYAYHLTRACWHGTRISLRQTSPEAEAIFDEILHLHRSCKGRWSDLNAICGISEDELQAFLAYAALFMCNLGNFYVYEPQLNIFIWP